MSGPDAPAREPADLRLLPLVAPLWSGEALVLLARPDAPGRVALVGVALVAAALAGFGRASRRRGQGRGTCPGTGGADRRLVPAVLAVVGLGLGLLLGSGHLVRLHPPLLEQMTAESAVLRATVRITGDPVAHHAPDDGGRAQPPSWSVTARLVEMQLRGRSYRLAAPVVLRGNPVEQLRYGALVDLTGRARASWAPHEQSATIQVLGPVRVRSPPGPVARITTTIRQAFRRSCAGVPADAAALLLGLAVGDESLLSPALDDAMVRSGLAHLTAVSGSNTSLVVGVALAATIALGLGWRARVGTSLLVLAGYVALVRPQPSVLRAAAMGMVALLALTTGGRRRGPPALLASALALLVWLPQYAISLGFALSFTATAGLLVVGPSIAERLSRWSVTGWIPEPVRAALAVAAAAHLATLPLSVLIGNGASVVALPANVVVTPLVPPATVLGLAAALVAPLWPAGAAVMAHITAPATGTIAWVARTASDVPHGVVAVPDGPGGALLTAVGLAVLAVGVHRGWRPWRSRVAVVATALLAAAAMVVRAGLREGWPPPDWLVLACDVGQGQALLLRRAGAAEALLVDVGPEGRLVARCLRESGVQRMVVLLTHFHADHVDGLASVLDGWPVAAVLISPVADPPAEADAVLRRARQGSVPVRALRAGDRLVLAGIPVEVRWPARRLTDSPANNGSVVALARVPTAGPPLDVLVTGDIEPEAQSAVMATAGPEADVVAVPHHGSRYQVPRFAAWTGARIALVSVGRGNDYGHPSQDTLRQYVEAGALVGRTDEQGGLAVVTRAEVPALVVQR